MFRVRGTICVDGAERQQTEASAAHHNSTVKQSLIGGRWHIVGALVYVCCSQKIVSADTIAAHYHHVTDVAELLVTLSTSVPELEMDRNTVPVCQISLHRYHRSVSSRYSSSLNVYIASELLQCFWLAFRFAKFSISSTDRSKLLIKLKYFCFWIPLHLLTRPNPPPPLRLPLLPPHRFQTVRVFHLPSKFPWNRWERKCRPEPSVEL